MVNQAKFIDANGIFDESLYQLRVKNLIRSRKFFGLFSLLSN